MPELPEAEANRRRIEASCLNRTIEAVRLGNDTDHVDLPDAQARARLEGRQFTEARRHGKAIFAGSKSGPWIAVSLGMTGSLRPFDAADVRPDHARLVVEFEGDRRLAFRCPRKLGWVEVVDDPADYIAARDLGPDAMEIDVDTFANRVGGSRGAIKSALMNQKKLAGIGNLWSDETLFRTGIRPDRIASDLPRGRIDALFEEMRRVLAAVSETDMDYSRLPDAWLIAHRDAGAQCRHCGKGRIEKAKVGGRSAYYCPAHQSGA